MKVYFLGTNGWYDTKTGNTLCVLVETEEAYLIFDAGNGFYKIGNYIERGKPICLFLSHYHLDHVIGLHALSKFNFEQGIDVYGPPGLKNLFKRVINKPYTIPLLDLDMNLRLHEISRGTNFPKGITYAALKHSVPCYGYRLYSENKTIAYCTDTGICKNLYLLAEKTSLFITECSFKPGQSDKNWPHLNPESAARVAREAGVKKLALLHFDASLYLSHKERACAAVVSRRIFKNTIICRDDMKMEV